MTTRTTTRITDAQLTAAIAHLDALEPATYRAVRAALVAANQPTEAAISITIVPNDRTNPPGKLADAEIRFEAGPLAGLKLIGFAIWERRTGTGRNVTFPARQYAVNGERRSFALLRPTADGRDQERIRDLILDAYARYEAADGLTNQYDQDGRSLQDDQPPGANLADDRISPPADPPIGLRIEDPLTGATVHTVPPADVALGRQIADSITTAAGLTPLAQAAETIRTAPQLDPGTVVASALTQAAQPARKARRF